MLVASNRPPGPRCARPRSELWIEVATPHADPAGVERCGDARLPELSLGDQRSTRDRRVQHARLEALAKKVAHATEFATGIHRQRLVSNRHRAGVALEELPAEPVPLLPQVEVRQQVVAGPRQLAHGQCNVPRVTKHTQDARTRELPADLVEVQDVVRCLLHPPPFSVGGGELPRDGLEDRGEGWWTGPQVTGDSSTECCLAGRVGGMGSAVSVVFGAEAHLTLSHQHLYPNYGPM